MNKPKEKSANPQFLSRDISWVDFNERVLNEGLRKELPLLERLRFLSIVSSNFDEFFMVRVAALKRMAKTEKTAADPSGLTAAQQLKIISKKVHSIINKQYEALRNEIFPGLAKNGLSVLRLDSCSVPQLDFLDSYFVGQVFPVLTPLRMEDDKPLPVIENRSLHAAFLIELDNAQHTLTEDETLQTEQKVIIPLPSVLDRIIRLPDHLHGKWSDKPNQSSENKDEKFEFVLLEDIITAWGAYLFPGYRIKESILFKVNRDADFSVDEQRDEDFIEAMEEVLEGRDRSEVVRMVYSQGSKKLRDELAKRFSIDSDYLYEIDGPINISDFLELANTAQLSASMRLEKLIEKPWKIYKSMEFSDDSLSGSEVSIWDRISQGDVMLHLPYQSFDPVVNFFKEAAEDPKVISIKTALYRTGGAIPGVGLQKSSSAYSPIVRALEQAALNGKHVTAVIELKARFDEERNISWANRLEKAGVIVVYGLSHLKVHSKISMVMRRENDRIKRFVHLSTGNYNDRTAKYYEDLCIFTCREDIAYDAGLVFNMLTGYSAIQKMARLVMAPKNLKRRFIELIERETARSRTFGSQTLGSRTSDSKSSNSKHPAGIMAKLNSLTDVDVINALYAASCAGVKISLCVRGICTLVPGIPGVSENIRVISVIDHYLEHSRIYYFANGGAEELYLASADLMPRNLERRVELMFPVIDEKLRTELLGILNDYFKDNSNAFLLNKDGRWTRLTPAKNEKPFRVQKEMLSRAEKASQSQSISSNSAMEYNVRRSPPLSS